MGKNGSTEPKIKKKNMKIKNIGLKILFLFSKLSKIFQGFCTSPKY